MTCKTIAQNVLACTSFRDLYPSGAHQFLEQRREQLQAKTGKQQQEYAKRCRRNGNRSSSAVQASARLGQWMHRTQRMPVLSRVGERGVWVLSVWTLTAHHVRSKGNKRHGWWYQEGTKSARSLQRRNRGGWGQSETLYVAPGAQHSIGPHWALHTDRHGTRYRGMLTGSGL